jgi:predicted transcriptional regulator
MSMQFNLDLTKLSYPKPLYPPDEHLAPLSPYHQDLERQQYWKNLEKWNAHQQQIQAAAQQMAEQQQKINDNYTNLLSQYTGIQQQLLAEIDAHVADKQEIDKLKRDMDGVTRTLNEFINILKK